MTVAFRRSGSDEEEECRRRQTDALGGAKRRKGATTPRPSQTCTRRSASGNQGRLGVFSSSLTLSTLPNVSKIAEASFFEEMQPERRGAPWTPAAVLYLQFHLALFSAR